MLLIKHVFELTVPPSDDPIGRNPLDLSLLMIGVYFLALIAVESAAMIYEERRGISPDAYSPAKTSNYGSTSKLP